MKATRLFAFLVLATLLAATGLAAGPAAVSELTAIRAVRSGTAVEVTIVVSGDFGNEVFRLTEPERLVMDLTPVDKISVPPQTEINAAGVLRVRTGQFKPRVARLAFDLETPAISYKIERIVEGLKITFRKEGEAAPAAPATKPAAEPVVQPRVKIEPPAEAKAEVKDQPRPAPVAAPPSPRATIPAKGPRFFVQIGGGIGAFLQPESVFSRTFPINGKNGTAVETYTMKMNTPAALSAGMNLRILGAPAKVGLAVEYWNFKNDGALAFSVPHPFLNDTPRTLTQASTSRSNFTSVSGYAIFHLFANGGLKFMAGPEIGYATGKFKFLDTIAIADGPPYTEAQLSIQSLTFKNESLSSFWAGVRIGIEYAFTAHLAGVLNLRGLYLSPEIGELSNKLVLSQAQAMIGVQYSF